jgi:acyl-CoA dehydrogenase
MNFKLTEEQKDLQTSVRDFVKAEFKKDMIQELLDNDEYPVKIWKKAAVHGLIGIHFPKEYSGRGLSLIENILVCEELCRGDSTIGICLSLADFASDLLLHYGNDEQKATWLPKVAEGQILSCGAFTEPDHGSDITDLDTTAVRDGDEWVINGSKMFISNGGPLAGFYSVLCKTDPGAKPSYRGLIYAVFSGHQS